MARLSIACAIEPKDWTRFRFDAQDKLFEGLVSSGEITWFDEPDKLGSNLLRLPRMWRREE